MVTFARLDSKWLARPAVEVAPELLGRTLVYAGPSGEVGGIIVETEAYSQTDPASHTFRGRTPRNAVMFGPAGYAYVYFTYGLHHCLNIVTGADGDGEAVLIRALEPAQGVESMQFNRQRDDLLQLCNGPAKLTQALGLNLGHNGLDLATGPLAISRQQQQLGRILVSPRIGISQGQDKLWRYFVEGNIYVSAPRRGEPLISG